MALILRPGDVLRRPPGILFLDYTATGNITLTAAAAPASAGGDVRTPAPNRLVVTRLAGPLVVTAATAGSGRVIDATGAVTLSLRLRYPSGSEEEAVTERLDLGGLEGQDVLRLEPLGADEWQISVARTARAVAFTAPAAVAAHAAARSALGGKALPPRYRVLAIDASASMQAQLAAGVLSDVVQVVAAVQAHDPESRPVPAVAYSAGSVRTLPALVPEQGETYVRPDVLPVPRGGGAPLAPTAERAGRTAETLIAVTDGAPPDLPALADVLQEAQALTVVLVALAESQYAVNRDDRPREKWREELGALQRSDVPRLRVLAVPPAQRLSEASAQQLARALVEVELR